MEADDMKPDDLRFLLISLAAMPAEAEWIEFKHNKADPQAIGEYISALANAAAWAGQATAYLVWGVEDETHKLVGTTFRPKRAKVASQELENWLVCQLEPGVNFKIHEFDFEGNNFVIIEIPAASHMPIRFKGKAYIRVGTYKKPIEDHPERERDLWKIFLASEPFEAGFAKRFVSAADALDLLDYTAYFHLVHESKPPDDQSTILRAFEQDRIIVPRGDRYDITNLGAALLARDMANFDHVERKGVRVIVYEGSNRVTTVSETVGRRGYANGFEGLMNYISERLPQNEHIERALRKKVKMYPEVAVRELVANAIVHQDLQARGTGPRIEIFTDRVEITNPGVPLIDTIRFLDAQPQSRNDALAAFLHQARICEERGSGIDKVFHYVEIFQLPPPDFVVDGHFTIATLFAARSLSEMGREERIRACYQHAGLQFVSNSQMTNTTLRRRLGIADKDYSTASRIIAETLAAKLIRPFDPQNKSRKHAKYVPFWA